MAKKIASTRRPLEKSRYRVPNLDRALSVLELLGSKPDGLNVSEISEALGIPKNSAFRIALTLETRGYLDRNEVTKKYRLTQKLLTLGNYSGSEENLFEKSLDVMRALRDVTRETAMIGVLLGTEGVVLDNIPSIHRFRFNVDAGTRFPLHTSAPGKAILAALPVVERDEIMAKLDFMRCTANTITEVGEFRDHIKTVGAAGYGVDLAEEVEGQHCAGAAIVNGHGYPIAALWITAPSSRLPESQIDEVGGTVKAHADKISTRFGRVASVAVPTDR